MNGSRNNALDDCELNISDGFHCNGFIELQEKVGKGFNCEVIDFMFDMLSRHLSPHQGHSVWVCSSRGAKIYAVYAVHRGAAHRGRHFAEIIM